MKIILHKKLPIAIKKKIYYFGCCFSLGKIKNKKQKRLAYQEHSAPFLVH